MLIFSVNLTALFPYVTLRWYALKAECYSVVLFTRVIYSKMTLPLLFRHFPSYLLINDTSRVTYSCHPAVSFARVISRVIYSCYLGARYLLTLYYGFIHPCCSPSKQHVTQLSHLNVLSPRVITSCHTLALPCTTSFTVSIPTGRYKFTART